MYLRVNLSWEEEPITLKAEEAKADFPVVAERVNSGWAEGEEGEVGCLSVLKVVEVEVGCQFHLKLYSVNYYLLFYRIAARGVP